MLSIEVSQIAKSFGKTLAVDDVSFVVEMGEVFGLLGPNGAGKTTIIRLLLDLIRPDRGRIAVLGGPMNEAKKNRIGYMPEERGLYADVPLRRCLAYLGSLKGLSAAEARRRADVYLERFGLTEYRKKKVKELSKGMHQKAQLIATLLHRPELVIVDEPFAGLDPINTEMVKQVLRELRQDGATIIMSTHQMYQVEAMCDRILLLNRGRVLLYGELGPIRRQFADRAVWVGVAGELPPLAGVSQVEQHDGAFKLELMDGISPREILQTLLTAGLEVERFEMALPDLSEIFVRVVGSEERGE